jgi:hypothetical protein
MASSARIRVEHTEEATADRAVCVVRCLEGAVSPGDVFDAATSTGGEDTRVSLRVGRIWRYDRPVDLLDPPHSAKVELTGQGTLSLPDVTHLTMTPGT